MQSYHKEIDLVLVEKALTRESIIIKVSLLWFMKLKYSWVHNCNGFEQK